MPVGYAVLLRFATYNHCSRAKLKSATATTPDDAHPVNSTADKCIITPAPEAKSEASKFARQAMDPNGIRRDHPLDIIVNSG